jgi:hypothetical protein
MKNSYIKLLGSFALCVWIFLSGCTSVNTFPTIARPGDTVSMMIGGSEQARKSNVSATLTDASGHVWDLNALGLVRSVFNLRTDSRAYGAHYSSNLDSNISWLFGHEPVQTVMIIDIPSAAMPGQATVQVGLSGFSDNSSGYSNPHIGLQIIPGVGASDTLQYKSAYGITNTDFTALEPAPNAKLTFGTGATLIGAASLVIGFDSMVVNPIDLNVYAPESTVRYSPAFGATQRMVYWHQDGTKLYVDLIAPQGIAPIYLQLFVVHPRGLTGLPAFNILSAQVYGTDGNTIPVVPTLTYSP